MNYADQSLVIFADTLKLEYKKQIFLELYECNNRFKKKKYNSFLMELVLQREAKISLNAVGSRSRTLTVMFYFRPFTVN